jgi:LDH2 family malate/lactate/ureidoglycolate dehydrogenase
MTKTPPPVTPPVTVDADALRGFAAALFARSGMTQPDAATVAEVLVWANLRGMDSHGVMRIPRYVELIQAGDMNPAPNLRVASETPASVLIDADRAAGPVAMSAAVTHALAKARDAGIGLALVRATTHTAAVGYYTTQAAEAGMIGIAISASWPNMAYHGARAAGASTNPISIAVPGGKAPIVLDMGTGIVSIGKLMQARKTGQPIPPGWALDAAGNPTTDPKTAQIPLPLGGAKGSGLSLMIELITSLLVANPLLAETLEGSAEGKRHRQNGAVIAIDIGRYCEVAGFRREVDRLIKSLKALPRDADTAEILLPGERGNKIRAQRARDGIPLPPPIAAELTALADKLGVPALGAI